MSLSHLTLLALLLAVPAASGQIYVDDDAPADPGPNDPMLGDPLEDGSQLHPFDSLAEAINATPSHGLILVHPGRYTGPGNRGIGTSRSFNLRSLRGADETIFDMEGVSAFLTLLAGTSFVTLEGLTIMNGVGVETGGIETKAAQTELWINASVLTNNTATGAGAVGGALTVRSALECAGTAFLSNSSAGSGGAIAIPIDSDNVAFQDIALSTFRGNAAAGDGGAIWAEGTATAPLFARSAVNCVFWENQASAGSQHQIGEAIPDNFSVSGSVVQGGWSGVGSGNLDVDPQFVFPESFHLSVATPVLGLTGGLICAASSIDADGQQRDCTATELGADEVLPVTLAGVSTTNDFQLDLAVAGVTPGQPVWMLVGKQLAIPSIPTLFGSLEVQPGFLRVLPLPAVDAVGTSILEVDVTGAASGTDLVFQALVGNALLPATTLTLP